MTDRNRLEKELEWIDAQQDRLIYERELYRLDVPTCWENNETTRSALSEDNHNRMRELMCKRMDLDRQLRKLPQPEPHPNPYDEYADFIPRVHRLRDFFPIEPVEGPITFTVVATKLELEG